MATGTLETARDQPGSQGWDPGFIQTLREHVDAARRGSFSPMALLSVDVAGRPLRIELGMSPELAGVVEKSELGSWRTTIANAQDDPRVPSTWRDRGMGASFSIPVLVDERFVGALHVVDARARDFTEAHEESIAETACVIGKRIERFLGPEREERRESLMRRAMGPTFAELRNALVPLNLGASDLRIVAADLLPLVSRARGSEEQGDKAAILAYDDLNSLIEEVSRAAQRVRHVVMAVEGLWGEGGRGVALSELLRTAGELALHSTRLVGGLTMPEVSMGLWVNARRSVAVAGLGLLLSRAAEANACGSAEVTPIDVRVQIEPDCFLVHVSGRFLRLEQLEQIATEVEGLLLGDRDLRICVADGELRLRLSRRS